eukprot:gene10074-64614_t
MAPVPGRWVLAAALPRVPRPSATPAGGWTVSVQSVSLPLLAAAARQTHPADRRRQKKERKAAKKERKRQQRR